MLHEDHRVHITQTGEDAYSRLVIHGKVYASRSDRLEEMSPKVTISRPTNSNPQRMLYAAPAIYTVHRGQVPLPAQENYGTPPTMHNTYRRGQGFAPQILNGVALLLAPQILPNPVDEFQHGGTLDLNKAARLILLQKRNRSFNQSTYDEFVQSECASRVTRFITEGLLDQEDPIMEMRLTEIANFLMERFIRIHEITKNTPPAAKAIFSVKNLTRTWDLEGPPPFKKVALEKIVQNFHPSTKNNNSQNFAALYRFILMRLAEPPQRIQQYAVRLNGKSGRNDCLIPFPIEIENFLLDFGEAFIDYGHNELKNGAVVNASNSR
ncbi:hypothetical protein Aduo_011510 [Ancylostoma duodenale]